LSLICYQTKTEWWQHFRNCKDLDESITVNVVQSRVFPWVGHSLGPNNHWEALQFQYWRRETTCSLAFLPSFGCSPGKKWTIIVGKWHMRKQWVEVSYPRTLFNSEDFMWIHVLFCCYWSWNWLIFTFTASLKQWTEKNFRGIWFKVTLEHADWVPILAKVGSLCAFSVLMIKC